MYNSETNEIAKPSELLASVKTYMSVLQTVEYYGKCSHHTVSYSAMVLVRVRLDVGREVWC